MPSKESAPVPRRAMAAKVMALVGVSVAAAAAAMLMAARPASGTADMPPVQAQPQDVSLEPTAIEQPQAATAEPTAPPPPIARQRKTAAASKAPAARALPVEMPAEEAIDASAFLVESAKGPLEESEAKGSVMESASKARVLESAAVTITGCLERNDETFRLKDTGGLDAPKSRSWKSGFLKKRSASIEVVDAADGLQLPDHVGQRVSVTGMLVDREMRVRSLLLVAESCYR